MDGPINPYAAPAVSIDLDAAPAVAGGGFKPLAPIARFLTAVFVLTALVEGANILNSLFTVQIMGRFAAGLEVAQQDLEGIDLRTTVIAIGETIVAISAVVAFCFFMARANRNARALRGAALDFSPRGSAGIFFVPIINLYQPYRAMKEIWQASQKDDDPRVPWQYAPVPRLLPWWWGLYLAHYFGASLASRLSARTNDPASFVTAAWSEVLSGALTIAASLAAAAVVQRLASLQNDRQTTRLDVP